MLLAAALFALLPQAPAPDTIRITLEHTACVEPCPVQSVTMTGDGSVTYEARGFVRQAGTERWHIDPAAVRALAREIDRAGLFQMKDEYTALVTDQRTIYTEVTIGTRHKRIRDDSGAPPALKGIESRIDDVSGVTRYVRALETALEAAAARGDAAQVKHLLADGADPRARDADGVTPVMKAAMSGDPDTVRAVLAAGGDPTARDVDGRNAADRVRDLLARDPRNPKLAEILRLLTDE